MTEGRCETCAHWEIEGDWRHVQIGWKSRSCKRLDSSDGLFVCCHEDDYDIQTQPQFGCTLYEEAQRQHTAGDLVHIG